MGKGRHIAGAEVTVSGAVPFTQEALEAATKPKTLVWDGKHHTDVSNWKDLVLKVLLKMQELTPAAFDQMADEKTFGRHLVKVLKPRERHSDCFTEKFGTEGKFALRPLSAIRPISTAKTTSSVRCFPSPKSMPPASCSPLSEF